MRPSLKVAAVVALVLSREPEKLTAPSEPKGDPQSDRGTPLFASPQHRATNDNQVFVGADLSPPSLGGCGVLGTLGPNLDWVSERAVMIARQGGREAALDLNRLPYLPCRQCHLSRPPGRL